MSLIIIAGSITKYKFRVLCCEAYNRRLDLRGDTGNGVLVNGNNHLLEDIHMFIIYFTDIKDE